MTSWNLWVQADLIMIVNLYQLVQEDDLMATKFKILILSYLYYILELMRAPQQNRKLWQIKRKDI